jgi:arsenate reductase (thioredoxin)
MLFLCVQNSGRSQMAEALARMLGGREAGGELREVHSAGIRPGPEVNPAAIQVMRELGYDMKEHRPKHVSVYQDVMFDYVIKMDVPEPELAGQLSAKWIETWDVPDPAKGGPEEYRKVRDILRERIGKALAER